MKVSCKDKERVFKTAEASTKSWFRVNGAIDKYLNIIDLKKFRKFNAKWSNYARIKFGVNEQLFFEENGGRKALPNKVAFKSIDSAKGIYYQKSNSSQQRDINTRLKEGFLKDFNVTVQEYDNIKEALGYNYTQMVSLVEKFVAVEKGKPIDKAVAYLAFSLLGRENSKVRSELRFSITSWDKYREKFKAYKNEIFDQKGFIEEKKEWRKTIKDRIIIDFLAEKLNDYHNNPEEFEKIEERKWTRADFTAIKKAFRAILDFLGLSNNPSIDRLNNVGNALAHEVLTRNYDMLSYDLGEGQILKNYEETIDSDPQAKEIVEFSQSLGLVLTGSLALRRAGTVYRTSQESLHDLDFVVPYEEAEKQMEIVEEIQKWQGPDAVVSGKAAFDLVQKFDWFKKFKEKYPTYKIINGFYGGEQSNFESYTLTGVIDGKFDDKGKHIEGTGYIVDHFVRLDPSGEQHENYFKLWKEIMIAKILMGRGKDFTDYKAFVPFTKSKDSYNFFYKDFIYQTSQETDYTEKDLKQNVEVEDAVEEGLIKFLDNYGIGVEYVDSLKMRGYDAVAIADITNKLIKISKGEADASTLPEEAAHFAVELLGEDNPIIKRLMDIIDQSAIYDITYEEYANDREYQKYEEPLPGLSVGIKRSTGPDINKIKKEAIGKAIANHIIKKKADNPKVESSIKRLWNWVLKKFGKIPAKTFKEEMDSLIGEVAGQMLSGELQGANLENLRLKKGEKKRIFKSKKVSKEENRARKALITLETRLKEIRRRVDAPDSLLTIKSTIDKIKQNIENNEYLLGISNYMSAVEESTDKILQAMENEDTEYSADILYDINSFLNLHQKTVSDIVTMMKGDKALRERGEEIYKGSREISANLAEMRDYLKSEMEKATIAGVNNLAHSDQLGESLFYETDSDMSWLSTWLGSAKASAKEIVKLLDRKLRDIKFNVDAFILDLGTDLKLLQEKLEKSGFKDFSQFYEKDEKGKKTGYLIRDKKWGEYRKAKEAHKKYIMELLNTEESGYEYKEEDYNEWISNNQDEQSIEKLAKLWKEFYDKHTVLKNYKRIPNDSYNNPEFAKLMKNPIAKEYYDKLVDIKRDAVEKLPKKYRNDHYVYWMPQTRKYTLNRLRNREQGIFRTIKEVVKEKVRVQKDETEYGNHEIVKNPITGEEIKFLPIHYHYPIEDMNNLSDDITSMYLSYAYMAENYVQKNRAKGDIWLIHEAVKNQKVNIPGGKQKAEGQSNTFQRIDDMINTRFYGAEKTEAIVNILGKKVDATKLADNGMAYVRRNNLVFNLFTHVANTVMGQAYQKIESISGKYTTQASAAHAEVLLTKNTSGMMMDIGARIKRNKVSLVMQKNDIIHDINSSFNHLDERTKIGRVFSKSGLYATYEFSDAHVKGKIALSVYDNYRLYNGKFVNYMQFMTLNKGNKNAKQDWKKLREKSLYNAYEAKNGKLVVKPEYEGIITRKFENTIRGIINQIVDEADGTLTQDDKTMLHRSAVGRAILTHRNWLLVGMQARWKKPGYNYVTEMEEEGYHRTFKRNFFRLFPFNSKNKEGETMESWMQRFKSFLILNEDMNPMEKANMKKAWADLVFIILVMVVAKMLNNIADDEPDDWTAQFMGYMGSRIRLEATSYSNPFEILDILDSPTAGLNQIESLANFARDIATTDDDGNWRLLSEIDRGGYKGKSRFEKFMIKRSILKPFYEASTTDVIKDKNRYLKEIGL